ncbi:tyrosine-type recombinase/integrase [Leucobacter chromiireducens]|uniref:Site-specific integrase n=1 Tax=Leucobacter chromiireducens subsp. solipictus TaxID=398235 RepID=A0ABS1SHY9_9MICO|nr:site-specific integrase [Leucobacter chromiireducens]MBL3679652.1 site-specific integrase [Leucobacter chromiireducens subsp. solipictus]
MTVKKHGNRWRAMVRKNGEYLGSRKFDLKRDAEAYERKLLEEYADGIDVRQGSRQVSEYVADFHEYRELMNRVSEATRETDKHMFKRVPTWFLSLRVKDVKTHHVEKALAEDAREHERKEGSIIRYRTTLSAFFTYLMNTRQIITRNPARAAAIPGTQLSPEKIPWLGTEIDERFLIWKEKDRGMAEIALVIYFLALRWGEARAMEVGDVMLDGKPRVLVQRSLSEGKTVPKSTKTKKVRWVPISNVILPTLQRMVEGRGKRERLFPELTRTRFKWRLRWDETGQGKNLHSLRHGGITAWAEAGLPVPLMQKWAGHARVETTMKYVHLVGDQASAAGVAMINAHNQRLGITAK